MTPSGADASADLLARAERAEALAPQAPAGGAPLRFAAALFRAQARAARALEAAHARRPLEGDLAADGALLVEPGRALLGAVVEAGPPPLAEAAEERRSEDAGRFQARLRVYWERGQDARDDYLSRALLRPYCAALAALGIHPRRSGETPARPARCPRCGGAPAVAARRPEGDGLRRSLCCALCGGEWPVNRILCPACGEEDPKKLPSFQSQLHPAARIEACDACRRYVKSIDLSGDGRLVPEVDDLASLGLDLWALEQGYLRIEPGLAGL